LSKTSTTSAPNKQILKVATLHHIQRCGANGFKFMYAIGGAANNDGVDEISALGPGAGIFT
jgi:hypothetical protein